MMTTDLPTELLIASDSIIIMIDAHDKARLQYIHTDYKVWSKLCHCRGSLCDLSTTLVKEVVSLKVCGQHIQLLPFPHHVASSTLTDMLG